MKATPRSPEQIDAEMQTFLTPEMRVEVAQSDELLGFVLRINSHEIPPEHLRWLKGFLRAHLSRPEYRLFAERYGWRKRKPPTEAPETGAADDPLQHPRDDEPRSADQLDEEIPS